MGGPKTGGPIPDENYAIQVVGLLLQGATTVVLLVDFADIVHRLLTKARELTKHEVAVSDGLALILAAEAVERETGATDLTVAFVTPMIDYLPRVHEGWSAFDGWLVGFRSDDSMQVVHIDRLGGVSIAGRDLPVTWTQR